MTPRRTSSKAARADGRLPHDARSSTPDAHRICVADQQSIVAIDTSLLSDIAHELLLCEGVVQSEISLALVDDATIHAINREFLEHDFPTDVISFRLAEAGFPPMGQGAGAERRIEGEVVISAETAARVAEELGTAARDEVALYLVHGLLHLCGYEDHTPEASRQMRELERRHLKKWGIQPHNSDGI